MKRIVSVSWLTMLNMNLAILQSRLDTKSPDNLITIELYIRVSVLNKRRITFLYSVCKYNIQNLFNLSQSTPYTIEHNV